MLKRSVLVMTMTFIVAMLVGCKADSLEFKLTSKQIQSVVDGESVAVQFDAEFSLLGELDEDGRADLDRLIAIAEEVIEIEDVELETTALGVKVLIDGSIPMTTDKEEKSPWFLKVSNWDESTKRVELATGSNFKFLVGAMESVNFMLSADPYHPVKFKLKAKGAEVVAPAVEIDGVTHLLYRGAVDGRLTMNFSGGAFDDVGAGFLIKLQ